MGQQIISRGCVFERVRTWMAYASSVDIKRVGRPREVSW